jgi:hypothetical protein
MILVIMTITIMDNNTVNADRDTKSMLYYKNILYSYV